jgi:hypothetical protein
MSQHSVASSCDQVESLPKGEYPVDPSNVGYCIIINQKNFYVEPNPCLKVSIVRLHSCCYNFGSSLQKFDVMMSLWT